MTAPTAEERRRRGTIAEDIAASFLRLRGCVIVDRNVRIAGGEIDLIARSGKWLFLIEVRFRTGARYGQPVESLRGRKARALARAARAYVANGIGDAACWRLDAVDLTVDDGGEVRIRLVPDVVPL